MRHMDSNGKQVSIFSDNNSLSINDGDHGPCWLLGTSARPPIRSRRFCREWSGNTIRIISALVDVSWFADNTEQRGCTGLGRGTSECSNVSQTHFGT